jgi:hypothetical protein
MLPVGILFRMRLRIVATSLPVALATRDAIADGVASGLTLFWFTLHSIISPSKLPIANEWQSPH